jgi:putative ABC transport system permease protein
MLADSLGIARLQTLLLGVFSGIALLLAAVGLYGVMSYGVSMRTQEIGIRMALGAERRSVLLMVLRQASVLAGTGLLIGFTGAVLLGRVLATALEPLLFQVRPSDTVTLTVVPAVLAAAALLASLVPARRASRVDPLQALRNA